MEYVFDVFMVFMLLALNSFNLSSPLCFPFFKSLIIVISMNLVLGFHKIYL